MPRLFEGGSYSLILSFIAGLIRMWVIFEGRSLLRIYVRYSGVSNKQADLLNQQALNSKILPAHFLLTAYVAEA